MGFGLNFILSKMDKLFTSEYESVVSINLFVALLCVCMVVGHLLEKNRWVNESITTLLIGTCTGIVILLTSGGTNSRLLVFSEDLFFIYLLPPIIFNAGFQVKKKQLFQNISTILLFGAIGTLISFAIISFGAMSILEAMNISNLGLGDYLAIGAIFSATDSVCTLQVLNQDETPLLYSLVFGEGVVNDATSVVLFNAIQNFDLHHLDTGIFLELILNFLYLFVASTVLGVAAGLLSAYIIKKLYLGRHSTDREVALMMLMAYQSYMLAELFDLSGILTVFFCGIVMSHYTWYNVTESSRITTKHAFAMLSFVCEMFIFLYVGMDALDMEKWEYASGRPRISVQVSSIMLGLVMVGRAAFVFPLSFLSNLTKKEPQDKIGVKQQVTIWWAGLMRGAVSMALAYSQFTRTGHNSAVMITSTISVVLFSTVVFGLMTKPLIRILLPPPPNNSTPKPSSEPVSPKSFSVPLLEDGQVSESNLGGSRVAHPNTLRSILTTPACGFHCHWRRFDNAYMRPVFGGRCFAPFAGSPGEPRPHQEE